MEQTKDIFGKRLLEIRESRGESQQELADSIGITRQSLSRYELGERTANIDLLKKVAEHYNVSADYLLGLTDNKTTDIDLQAICNYTGLNEKAIKSLNLLSQKDDIRTENIGKQADLFYSGFNEETIKFLCDIIPIDNYKVRCKPFFKEIESWIISNHYLSRIASALEMILRLSSLINKVDEEINKIDEEYLENSNIDPNEFIRLNTNCDIERYTLIKIAEEMSNHFDQRKQVQDDGEHNPPKE